MKSLGWPSVAGTAVLVLSCFLGHSVAQGSGPSVQLSPGDLPSEAKSSDLSVAPQTETVTVDQLRGRDHLRQRL